MTNFAPNPEAVARVPRALAFRHDALALNLVNGVLAIALPDPDNVEVVELGFQGGVEGFGVLDEEFDLDGNVEWNPARFLNHSCAPNSEAVCEDGRVWIVGLRDIQPGEEITFNYGYDLADYDEHPCQCRAPECVGYIVAEALFLQIRKFASL